MPSVGKVLRKISAMSYATALRISVRSLQFARSTQRLCGAIPRTPDFLSSFTANGFLGICWLTLPRTRVEARRGSSTTAPFLSVTAEVPSALYTMKLSTDASLIIQSLSLGCQAAPVALYHAALPFWVSPLADVTTPVFWFTTTTGRPVLVRLTV